jgi:hypothetical protein
MGTVLTYLAGLVFTFEKETCEAIEDSGAFIASGEGEERCLSQLLEYGAALVIVATTGLAAYAEFQVARTVRLKTKIGMHMFLEKEIAAQDTEHKSAHDKRVEQARKKEARFKASVVRHEEHIAKDESDSKGKESEQANADTEGRREEGDFDNPLSLENANATSEENGDGEDDLARYVEAMCQACLKAGGRKKDMAKFKEAARKQLEECLREVEQV